MLRRLLFCLLLCGCTDLEKASDQTAAQEAAKVGTLARRDAPYDFVYLLVPTQELLDKELQFHREQALAIYLEDPSFTVSDERLLRYAQESAASAIAVVLDDHYGEQVRGEVLPRTGVIIIKSQVPLDLDVLKGLIDD